MPPIIAWSGIFSYKMGLAVTSCTPANSLS